MTEFIQNAKYGFISLKESIFKQKIRLMYTLKKLVMKIRFRRSEISLLSSEKWAFNLLIVDHFSLWE